MTPAERPSIPAAHFALFLGALTAFATVGSFILVLINAWVEPYTVLTASDALSQIGLGCVFIALWLALAAGVCCGVATRRLPALWLLLLPWAATVLFYLRLCPWGYIEDMMRSIRTL